MQDLEFNTASSNSFLYIEVSSNKENGETVKKFEFTNNAMAYLFREIRYELNRKREISNN